MLDPSDGGEAGNIRSSITHQGGKLYFTSQGKYLWEVDPFTQKVTSEVKLAGVSTSTPTILNNRIYVGYYNGFTAGGIQVIDKTTKKIVASQSVGPVQSSIIGQTKDGVDHIYFTTNSSTGAGYSYRYDGTKFDRNWDTLGETGNTYTLQGMAESNGYLMFGNDFNYVTVVK